MKNIFLVDADDTILDFHGASAKAIRYAFSVFNIPWQDSFASVFKRVNDGLWERLERRELTREKLIEIRFPLYLKELGVEGVDGDKFNEIYLHYIATNPMYMEGAEEFLKKLGKIGRVFIVTNGTQKIQESRFAISGLNALAEDVFVSQAIGYDKPAKQYTEYVLSHIPNFKKENAVWIGDSLSADIKAANAANITSIWFNPSQKALNGQATPDFIVDNFEKIFDILQRIRD